MYQALPSYSELAFGPVPSRRLGRSLGLNTLPLKICSYSCSYCQLGFNKKMSATRAAFYDPEAFAHAVGEKLEELACRSEKIDYITFVPDGEPTLDKNLGKVARLLGQYSIPLAIITNGSLIWDESVQEDLSLMDLVSIKVDAHEENVWRKVNHPSRTLKLDKILEGIRRFDSRYGGRIITETMVVNTVDYRGEFFRCAEFLASIKHLETAYLSIPTRPPADPKVSMPDEHVMNNAYQTYREVLGDRVELLVGYEGTDFSATGDFSSDLLAITAVHPMREDAVEALEVNDGARKGELEALLAARKVRKVLHHDKTFYIRAFRHDSY